MERLYKKIAIITARSGSKGLPDKNILMLGNKPVLAYSVEAAVNSGIFERIIVSTDSEEYREISEKYGAEVMMRSEELASDTATSYQVLEDVLNKVNTSFDYFILLQPTSPFRTAEHIKEAAVKFEKNIDRFDFLVSMVESGKSSGLFVEIEEDESLKNYKMDFSNYRRQSYKEYHPNGAIFLGKKEPYLLKKHFYGEKSLAYIMNKEDSVDIDDALDFEIALTILNKKNKRKLLKNSILDRIRDKKEKFKEKEEITLLGHSILDNFTVENISGKKVNNLGIRGINTKEYNEYIFEKGLIKELGKYVVLMFGTNDIVIQGWKKQDILSEIEKIIQNVKKINMESEIFFIEITRVGNRIDRKNNVIDELNAYLYENLKNKVKYLFINEKLENEYGKLNEEFTYDGLHLNEKGNRILEKIIEEGIR